MPSFDDVLRAHDRLRPMLEPTPLRSYPALNATTEADVLVKHENVLPTCAFKVRGGLNLLAGMSEVDRRRGVVTYSTGNHAQSLAYACRTFEAQCTVVMPANPNPAKAAAVKTLGATLIEHGAAMDDAGAHAAAIAAETGARLITPAEDELVAGVATATLELFDETQAVDTLVVPVGGGSGAAAACVVAAAVAPHCEIVAVQTKSSPAAYESWRSGQPVKRPNATNVEGLATGCGFEATQRILRERLHDFVLVTDEEIAHAQWIMLRDAHTLAEGAGAASLAAVLTDPDRFRGRNVAIMCTGANAAERELRALLTAPIPAAA